MAFIQKISFDALMGPEDSAWGWQQGIDQKLQIEEVIREIVDKVAMDAERLPVARVLFAEHEDDEEISDIEISEDEYDNLWLDTRHDNVRTCEVCSQNEWTIWERIRTGQGEPIDSLREHEGRLICGCCQEMLGTPFSEYKWCCNCFVSEKMCRRYGISMISVGGSPEENICSVCNDIYPNLMEEMYNQGDDDDDDDDTETVVRDWIQLLDGTWVLDGSGDVYDGEYENVDPLENNTEIAKEIKETISEIGENLFDIKEKLTEGEYLKMMDLLQKVTNDVNRL